jgi:hypothetical protein
MLDEGESGVRSTVGLEGEGVGFEEGLDFSGPPVACPLYANRALALSEEQCGGGGVVKEGCMTLCEATYGIACEGLELEYLSHALCEWLVHLFCEKACSSATKRPWPDCYQICKDRPDCDSCCYEVCSGKGATKECHMKCLLAPAVA